MSLRRFFSPTLIAICLVTFTGKAHAQAAVYAARMGGQFGFNGDDYPNGPDMKPASYGFIAGGFYNFAGTSRFKAGLDGRVTYSTGYNGGKAYTGGIRFSFVPKRFPLRPYAQFGAGAASTQLHESICNGFSCGVSTQQISSGIVQLNAGLDVRVTRHFDIRAFDYASDSGGTRGLTSAAARSYSAGLVLHFGSQKPRNR